MAVEVHCDYCGGEIDGGFATVNVGALGDPRSVERSIYQYHADPPEGEWVACYERAGQLLEDAKRWAHDGEDGDPPGLVWRLDRRPRAIEAPNPKMMSTAPVRGSLPLDGAGLQPRAALSLRRAGVRTLEEAAERSEIELLAVEGVARRTVRQLAEALAAHELGFRPGPSAEELGSRIRELREAAGLRRSEVALAIRTDGDDALYESDLSAWESGRRVPTPRRLERLAEAFGVELERFTDREAV